MFGAFSSLDMVKNGGSLKNSCNFKPLACLSFCDDMTNGSIAVDAFDGVEQIEGLEYGRSTYRTDPNRLEIGKLIFSIYKLKKIIFYYSNIDFLEHFWKNLRF